MFLSNFAHSEGTGISHVLHKLLCQSILTIRVQPLYWAKFQNFPFTPGWRRLQYPLTHIDSYTLSENIRAAVLRSAVSSTLAGGPVDSRIPTPKQREK